MTSKIRGGIEAPRDTVTRGYTALMVRPVLLLVVAGAALAAGASDNVFNGRWDITVPGDVRARAWWLEVSGAGTKNVSGKFVGAPGGQMDDPDHGHEDQGTSVHASQVEIETAGITHVAAKRALAELKDSMSNGSFARVTDAYQRLDIELTTQVDQVRKFRNWVAHGRREAPENSVTPEEAFERLRRHLDLVRRTGGSPDRTT